MSPEQIEKAIRARDEQEYWKGDIVREAAGGRLKPLPRAPWAWWLVLALACAILASSCADGFDYQFDKAQQQYEASK